MAILWNKIECYFASRTKHSKNRDHNRTSTVVKVWTTLIGICKIDLASSSPSAIRNQILCHFSGLQLQITIILTYEFSINISKTYKISEFKTNTFKVISSLFQDRKLLWHYCVRFVFWIDLYAPFPGGWGGRTSEEHVTNPQPIHCLLQEQQIIFRENVFYCGYSSFLWNKLYFLDLNELYLSFQNSFNIWWLFNLISKREFRRIHLIHWLD